MNTAPFRKAISEHHHRKNELILSEESSEWYNPTYFAKIDIKQSSDRYGLCLSDNKLHKQTSQKQ